MNSILLGLLAGVITWLFYLYAGMIDRWTIVCRTLGVPSNTHPHEVYDQLITVVDQSRIFEEFIQEQVANDFEEVDYESDVETNPPV